MASRSLNKAIIIGNLTRDPELRYTPQGTAVCTFGVATNRTWVSDGQQQEDVEFHRVVAWQKLAELCSQLLFKGRKVYVEGRLQTRKWTGKDGQERQTTEIVIDNMIVLDSRRKEGQEGEERVPVEAAAGGTGQVAVADDKVKADDNVPATAQPVKKTKKKEVVEEKTVKGEDKKEEKEADEEKVSADDIPF